MDVCIVEYLEVHSLEFQHNDMVKITCWRESLQNVDPE